ncbi:cytochrome p450 71b25 [Colletotrichum truncatum]|uniref:Cytochrome p450 71b25 n=1 Tax=Colletotrichum truncatum TaxID=5467 RepID=A0ACC3Z727_COLTU|nr:cytochrome p450 71b25 [Colletotrichum truncatum]KAF6785253.1 cytochrome p450 71b25 [Colletotrichum truncatum]
MLFLISDLNKCLIRDSCQGDCTLVTIFPRIVKVLILLFILIQSLCVSVQNLFSSVQTPTTFSSQTHKKTTLAVSITTGTYTNTTIVNTTVSTMHLTQINMLLITAVIGGITYFAFSLYKARSFFRRLQNDGIPMPPHNFILGHLGLMMSIMISLPRDVMPTVVLADQVRRRYPHLDKAFYLDMWPFTGPMLMVISPDLMRQATQGENSLPKVAFLKNYIKPLSGGHDLVSMEGDEWKRWRDVFRPAFGRATELVPNLVESICVFRDQLVGRAKTQGGVFQLHHSALMLAMDMSGKAIWNHNMDSQKSYNDMADAIVSQLRWLLVDGFMPFASLNFIRPLVHMYNGFRMERYIAGLQQKNRSSNNEDDCIINRAISKVNNRYTDTKATVDPYAELGGKDHFDRVIRSQMRFLLLAGYDTTGSTITYVLHILSKHPEVLAKVREEHNRVLGSDVSCAAQQLKRNPHLVNNVPYTMAVIKETLRLYPPTSTLRNGKPGFYLYDRDSTGSMTKYPTEGCIVFGNHHGLHHNPRYWKEPDTFLPERFLTDPSDPSGLHPLPDTWRPFEKGPRACMGSELAMVEIKAVIMLVAREFDFTPAYEELEAIQSKTAKGEAKIGLGVLLPGKAPKHVNGDRVYQTTGGGGSHPADGYPSRVRFAL